MKNLLKIIYGLTCVATIFLLPTTLVEKLLISGLLLLIGETIE